MRAFLFLFWGLLFLPFRLGRLTPLVGNRGGGCDVEGTGAQLLRNTGNQIVTREPGSRGTFNVVFSLPSATG